MNLIKNSLIFKLLLKLMAIYNNSGLVRFFAVLFGSIKDSYINTHMLTPLESTTLKDAIYTSLIYKYLIFPIGHLVHVICRWLLACFNQSMIIKTIKRCILWLYAGFKHSLVYKVVADQPFGQTDDSEVTDVSFFKILLYIIAFTFTIIDFKYITALCIMLFVLFMIEFVGKKDHFKFEKLDGAVLLYFVFIAVGTFSSLTPYFSTKLLLYNLVCVMVYFMISRGFSKKEIKILIMVFLLGSMLAAALGLYQQLRGVSGEKYWIDEKTNPGLSARIFSFFGNPNVYGEYLILMIALGGATILGSKNWLRQLAGLAMTGINVLLMLLTFSRGAWGGIILVAIMFLVCYKPKWIPFFMILAMAMLFVLPQTITDRLLSIFLLKGDTSTNYRVLIWHGSYQLLKDFWDTGVGFGYGAYLKAYNHYQMGDIYATHSHNTFLQIFIELGIAGLLSFLYLIFKTTVVGLKKVGKVVDTHSKLLLIASVAAVWGLLTHGLVEYVFFDIRINFLFWVMLSLVSSVNIQIESSEDLSEQT